MDGYRRSLCWKGRRKTRKWSLYAAAGTDWNSLSRVETAQTIRASLLATAIAALLCPRERMDLPRPGAELVGRALVDVGRSEHGASALREERTEVGVATLGDAPEAANVTTGVLFGNEAEVTREAVSRWEAAQIPNEADDGGRGQKSDAGNGEKSLHLRKLLGERLESRARCQRTCP